MTITYTAQIGEKEENAAMPIKHVLFPAPTRPSQAREPRGWTAGSQTAPAEPARNTPPATAGPSAAALTDAPAPPGFRASDWRRRTDLNALQISLSLLEENHTLE